MLSFFKNDWSIFMAAANSWWQGSDPYGFLPFGLGGPGTFAYPPTALTWYALFLPLGGFGYYAWTALQLGCWWLLIRRNFCWQLVLLLWSPLLIHLFLGQSTFAIVLVLWAATLAKRRGFLWGIALAWTLTKPQVALIPIVWLLFQDYASSSRYRLWAGIITGTMVLAVPPTIMDPYIWVRWMHSLVDYRTRMLIKAPWQGFGAPILLLASVLWYLSYRGNQKDAGWQWWLTAALLPQGHLYSSVVLVPLLRPQRTYWTIAGLAVSSMLIGPATEITLPIILSGHLFAAWIICGGPVRVFKPDNISQNSFLDKTKL
jgi:hypothetical protein